MDKLVELIQYGQSYWLDDLSRKMIKSGELKRRVTEQGLRGMTSNPTIFDKAISESKDYDSQIKKLVDANCHVQEIYEKLTIKDVQDACDILKPVYEGSAGADGFVSLEVSPYLAHNTEGTMKEVRRFFSEVNRPNCFIKIPGTAEGVPAIEQMLYEGININITLLFSIESYEAVAYAYIRALKRRLAEGKLINNVASVASFFLSRIDVLSDQLLGHRMKPGGSGAAATVPELLLGKVAVANAKLAYQKFRSIFTSPEWQVLAHHGGRVQRPLWASTSTKDPLYEGTKYVDTLIGQNTVNTLPEETIAEFAKYGKLQEDVVEKGVEESERIFNELKDIKVDIHFITKQLENEGIQKFIDSYNELMKIVAQKRIYYLGDKFVHQKINSEDTAKTIKAAYNSLDEKQFGQRLANKDPYLWTSDRNQSESLYNRLGWLDCIDEYEKRAEELAHFTDGVRNNGFKHVLLLGMGGSSLCPEVSALTFGSKKGFPQFFVLDNTSPEAIRTMEKKLDIRHTLFIVSSKSGTTKETQSFYRYFYSVLEKIKQDKPGENFIAITDPGSWLSKEAEDKHFRHLFENRSDIGGRYSALSYFGLVPMALIGMDLKALFTSAKIEMLNCGPFVPSEMNPGIQLGTVIGMNYKKGRDKLTFIISEQIQAFGSWIEQLIAESTGKSGRGLVPVVDETTGKPENYGKDRIFIYIRLKGVPDNANEAKVLNLEKTGFPVIRIELKNKYQLGGEYYRWETAVAAAGAIIGINPFDEPNVAESKKNTENILEEWKRERSFPEATPVIEKDGIKIYVNSSSDWYAKLRKDSFSNLLRSYLKLITPGDYFAFLPYFMHTQSRNRMLQSMRMSIRSKYKTAATLGYGPRYLHSTGQLHKGGPNTGVFIIFTADSSIGINIPEEDFGFSTLQFAQALGDYNSLISHHRRVIRIHLGGDIDSGLKKLEKVLK